MEKVEIPRRLRDFQAQGESPALGLFHGAAFSTALLPINCRAHPQIQKKHLKKAAIAAEIRPGSAGTRSAHLSFLARRSGAPIKVQQELMRHASIMTTMNVYGKAMPSIKREANSKVVSMALAKEKKGAD